ncbi:unnamed protein product [Rotaria sordida]|uniref:Rho-GAP domain-containing protein n=1 Tax=Rotaria sordida TaxID=392033 RepID=A0A813TS92_9BILA|nr:unnamed protein product [Rotaria sordida]CAF0816618.1 unnamed protein product [Rotaria sordida]
MSLSLPIYCLSVVSIHPLSGKSSLCKRLIDSNIDSYQLFLSINNNNDKNSLWYYWGSIKHRRLDEQREGIFHLIEHSSISTDNNESIDNYLRRISILTLRIEEKLNIERKNFSKDKININGFLCVYDLSSNKPISDFLILLHTLLKTRRPILIVTTKNDLINNQSILSIEFEQSIHYSLPTIPIIHTSAHEHVNIQSVLELALYACDETTKKSFHKKYIPPNYTDAYKNEQSLKHIIQTEYRGLLNRHVPDFRIGSWEKFYDRWQNHTSVQTFIDMFGKQQAKCLYDEHIEELRKTLRQKLIDERLIPIIEMLLRDQKSKISRNWDYVRLQMQKHPDYSSTVIPSSMWSDLERNNTNKSLIIPDYLLDTFEARLRFESYINNHQIEQTRRINCRLLFDLLNRFSNAGLIHYGDAYDKDCVYFLGRECYESLNVHDRLRIFALHQSYLYRLICLQFVELLFESLEIFINTFEQMNLVTKLDHEKNFKSRKITTVTIDDIFQKEIIQQIKHDSRYQSLNTRENDRHRLIMCHCHFLYDCIYYPLLNINQLLKQRRRSYKRRKSSSISLFSNMYVDDSFCPYTRKILFNNNNENEGKIMKKFEIGCPMENTCADIRIVNEILTKLKLQNSNKNILICGNDIDVNHFFRILSNGSFDFQINFLILKNLEFQIIDGFIFVSSNAQQILQDYISQKKIHLNINTLPSVDLYSQIDGNFLSNIPNDIIKSSFKHLLSYGESLNKIQQPIYLRILLCFMCGGETNDVEIFSSQLSSRFSFMINNQSSFIINTFLDQSNRKIELIPVSFHSLFAIKLTDFDGFILFYDRDRKAAFNTMIYMEKYISVKLKEKNNDDENTNETTIRCPPIYILSCVKEPTLSNTRKFLNDIRRTDYCYQCHSGTIRNFVESHLLPFLNQCSLGKYGNTTGNDQHQTEELLAGVTSYLDRATYSSANDLMTHNLERTHEPLINSINNDRMVSLTPLTKSNEDSPKHQHSLSTPTNHEQSFTYQSYPYVSNSTNGNDSTIVPTTPVDPSISNLSFISSTNSISDYQRHYFQKSTSMRFAKLIEHPINYLTFNANISNYDSLQNSANSLTRQRISEVEEMKYHLYKHRTAAHVKVPLATPEVIELNEIMPFSIQEYYKTSSSIINNNKNDLINSSSSIIHNSTIDESITDSSKQTRVTDSSIDSSSDEHLRTSTPAQNVVVLQRKVSDRKIKRVRAKQNDITGSASSSEVLKKPGSDDDILNDDDKGNQKKKRRPSFKRRKKSITDQTQTDSGIDSRMDSKDSNRANNTPELSTNFVISNEEDSSVGDCTKDSKNASIEELEERPTANWIRRQLQYFAQVRRDKNELKSRFPALATVCAPPPLFKSTLTTLTSQTHQIISPFSSLENSHQHVPIRLKLGRCVLSNETGIPLFVEKCVRFIEQHGLTVEGLYRISGFKNQVELIINKLNEDPNCDLNLLEVPASAVATAFKDMMRKLDEPILSLEQFDQCQLLTIDQLREQNFIPIQKALLRTNDLKYRTNKFIFKHLHFVSQHAALTHMDSSNLAVLWWPNLFQPQFHDLRTAEQICQKAKPLIQAIIDNYPIIFSSDQIKDKI